tara:strand:- start:2256 stop:4043 length:1788 start_codon:yes stop_codon:yes gene_type:complete
MAVSGVKGTGIGQVTIPTREDVEKMVRSDQKGILDILGSYSEGLMSGTGEKASEFLPVPDFAPEPQTRLGQLFDFPGILESAAKGARIVTGAPAVLTKSLGDILSSPTEAGIQSEIDRIESELSPFREQLRRTKAGVPDGEVPVPGLGTFTTADAKETRPEKDPVTGEEATSGVDGSAEFTGNVTDEGLEDITKMALQDYLDQARPGTQPKDYKEYIKEFADATGLDVSGKPDKSTALMALGLSLMQNRAGKGFDVGKMLGAVGEAGEAALPAYQKAKSEARALRAKAGEYALGRKKEDEAKAQQRNFMYVVPKQGEGKTEKERLANRVMRGKYIRVNASELNALDTNEDFNRNYEFLPPDALTSMKDLFKAPESKYGEGLETLTLFEDKDGPVEIKVRFPKAGFENLPTKAASSDQIENGLSGLNARRAKLDQVESRFQEFSNSFTNTPPRLVPQAITAVTELTRAIGFLPITNFKQAVEGENDVQKQKRFLEWVSTSYAPEILQESGKTISDADRERVKQLVGDIKLLSDPVTVAARVNQLHGLIIQSSRAKLAEGYERLNRVGGGVELRPLSEEDKAELAELRKQIDLELKK